MFDKEEMDILEALEKDELTISIDSEEEIAFAQIAAKEYLSKSKNITVYLSLSDAAAIKKRSVETGISYQTIISTLIHQYATGKIQLEA